jgi:hypothetical protein
MFLFFESLFGIHFTQNQITRVLKINFNNIEFDNGDNSICFANELKL